MPTSTAEPAAPPATEQGATEVTTKPHGRYFVLKKRRAFKAPRAGHTSRSGEEAATPVVRKRRKPRTRERPAEIGGDAAVDYADAHFNISTTDPDGRILVPASWVHPEDRPEPLPTSPKLGIDVRDHVAALGIVDLAPLAGRRVRLRRKGVLRILGIGMSWDVLLEHRAIEATVETDDGFRFYLLDPAATLDSIYREWVATRLRRVEVGDWETFGAFKEMYRTCRQQGMPPESVLRTAFKMQRRIGSFAVGDMRAYMPLPGKLAAVVTADMQRRAGARRMSREGATDDDPVPVELLASEMPFLKSLPETCFVSVMADRHDEPDADACKRIWRMGPMSRHAALYAFPAAPRVRVPWTLSEYVRSLHRFERLAMERDPDFDTDEPAQLLIALRFVAFSPQLRGRMAPEARDLVVRQTMDALRQARRYCTRVDRSGDLGILALAPTYLGQQEERALLAELRRAFGKQRAAWRPKRKKRAFRLLDRYERVIDGAAFRAKQIIGAGDAARATVDVMLGPAGADRPFRDMPVECQTLDERGLPTGGMHMQIWRCWRVPGAWASLSREGMDGRRVGILDQAAASAAKRSAKGVGAPLVFEFLRVERLSGPEPGEPWCVSLGRGQVFGGAGSLSPKQCRSRFETMVRMRLPGHLGSPEGLMSFERHRADLARNGAAKDRLFFPLEEFEHAMRLAAHSLDAVVQSWCRLHEALQQTEWKEDWKPDQRDGRRIWRFLAIDKLVIGKPIPLVKARHLVDDPHYQESRNLIALTVRRCHEDGQLPIVPPHKRMSVKLPAEPWVFSFGGAALEPQALNCFLHYLLAGIGQYRFHDFRHSASASARSDGLPVAYVKVGLHHRSEKRSDYYSALSAKTRAKFDSDDDRLKQERLARRSDARKRRHFT